MLLLYAFAENSKLFCGAGNLAENVKSFFEIRICFAVEILSHFVRDFKLFLLFLYGQLAIAICLSLKFSIYFVPGEKIWPKNIIFLLKYKVIFEIRISFAVKL